eukprot:gene31043-23210_t
MASETEGFADAAKREVSELVMRIVETAEDCKDTLVAQITSQKDAKIAGFTKRVAALEILVPHILRAKHGGETIRNITDVLGLLRAQPAVVDFVHRILELDSKTPRMPTAAASSLKCDPLASMRP